MPSSSSNPSTMITNLPHDLLLNCLARVSRLYYPTLSLVSKRFRSILTSTELYETRRLLGCTESCIYVISRYRRKRHWFTLSRAQTRIPNPYTRWFTSFINRLRNRTTRNLMVSVLSQEIWPMTRLIPMTIVNPTTVGFNIYMIGGYLRSFMPSCRVFFMDCRSHTWHEAPSMLVAKAEPFVNVLDGKIYVVERIPSSCDLSIFIEFFDPKTQIWEHVPIPGAELLRGKNIKEVLTLEGNLYLLFEDKGVVYKPKEGLWDDAVGIVLEMLLQKFSSCYNSCVIDNVLYRYAHRSRMIEWYDSEGRSWKALKGLEELSKLPKDTCSLKLVNYGGKIVVWWEEELRSKRKMWCAEIALERHNGQEICGKVKWCDFVLTVPKYSFEELMVATV